MPNSTKKLERKVSELRRLRAAGRPLTEALGDENIALLVERLFLVMKDAMRREQALHRRVGELRLALISTRGEPPAAVSAIISKAISRDDLQREVGR